MKSMKNISNTGMKYTSKNRISTQTNLGTSKQIVLVLLTFLIHYNMPVNNLPSPRNNWERPRDIFDYLVDENGDSVLLDDMTRISI